ncbi:hypothetical protein NPX13_g10031 [Xylaria arbuscula]|uniref:Uncharacterized protein n=1 Tax=Xylaria arbuscula TaxID=114810 RepID=A0A9W8N5L1_9PEZI|nr:hypothetical protein NPX13_g10031 [Xylaria arbuscula]
MAPAAAAMPRLESPDDDGEDPLAFLASLPTAGRAHSDDEDEERPKKRAKKWFEDDSADEKKTKKGKKGSGKVIEISNEPDTLEDYEALAAGLLDD